MTSLFRFLVSTSLILSFPAHAFAEVPFQINIQGRLLDGSGDPLPPGPKTFTFKLFDVDIGGTEVWPGGPGETQIVETDPAGLWNAYIGAHEPIPPEVFLSPSRWLEIVVDDGINPIDTLPRVSLATTPYAYRSALSQQADWAYQADSTNWARGLVPDVISDIHIVDGTISFGDMAQNGAADGQIMKWAGGVWFPADDETGLSLPFNDSLSTGGDAVTIRNTSTGSGVAIRGISSDDDAVVGWTGAAGKSGVYGYSTAGTGVAGRSEGGSHGVYGESNSLDSTHAGVRGINLASGPGLSGYGPNMGVYASSSPSGLAARFDGDVFTQGRIEVQTGGGVSAMFTSDTLYDDDVAVVHIEYSGPAPSSGLAAAIQGVCLSEDSLGAGGHFEGGFVGVDADVRHDRDLLGGIGVRALVVGGQGLATNNGVVGWVEGHGNAMNTGLSARADGGTVNYGLHSVVQDQLSPSYPALVNYGIYSFARDGDTCYGARVEAQTADSVCYGIDASAGFAKTNIGGNFLGLGTNKINYGVYAEAKWGSLDIGIFAVAADALDWAGYFVGDVQVLGDLYADNQPVRIDHPLDPENQYLVHAALESPEQLNVYSGNETTDAAGYATVSLPAYFSAINRDLRYQLTVIGDFAQAVIAEEATGNEFVIRTDKPQVKVSWQVTGVRNDALARSNPMKVEVVKPDHERGTYLHPEAYGVHAARGVADKLMHHRERDHNADARHRETGQRSLTHGRQR